MTKKMLSWQQRQQQNDLRVLHFASSAFRQISTVLRCWTPPQRQWSLWKSQHITILTLTGDKKKGYKWTKLKWIFDSMKTVHLFPDHIHTNLIWFESARHISTNVCTMFPFFYAKIRRGLTFTCSCSRSTVACCRDLKSWGTVKLGALAGDLWQSPDEAGDPSGMFSRTSFTMSAGDLNTKGGWGDRDSLLGATLLLGGL